MKKYSVNPKEKFNRLTVIKFDHSKNGRSYFLFQCDCGEEKVILGSLVKSGNTKSCGCLSKETKQAKRFSENHTEITAIILDYKRHAVDRNYEWLLTREEVEKIINLDCHYCKIGPSNIKKTKNSLGDGYKYSGIDRVNSIKGYTYENVVPCCKICNYAKSNLTFEEFKKWAIRIGQMADQWS